jgi:hypothetical protein
MRSHSQPHHNQSTIRHTVSVGVPRISVEIMIGWWTGMLFKTGQAVRQ